MKNIVPVVLIAAFVTGCASVPMAARDESAKAKQFGPPTKGSSGVYIYRLGGVGGALKKDVWIDGKCIGETAPNMFFYTEVAGGQEHAVSTESEFSPNDLKIQMLPDTNYFVKQYIKMGVFVGGAGIDGVSEAQGKADIQKLEMATPGKCS